MQILRVVYIHVLERLQTLFLSHSLPKWKQKNSFQSFAPKQWKICDFLNWVFFYCLKRLAVFLERHQTLLIIQIYLKGNDEETLNFCLKPWTNLFEKNGKFTTFLNRFLLWSRQASFLSRTSKSLFLGKVCLKRNFKLFIKTMD